MISPDLLFYLFLFLFSVFMEGFFSGSEIAFVSLDFYKFVKYRDDPRYKDILFFKENPSMLLNVTLIGTNLSAVFSSTLSSMILGTYFHLPAAFSAVFIVLFMLFFGEILPKILYQANSEKVVFIVIPFIKFFYKLFYPLSFVTRTAGDILLKKISYKLPPSPTFTRNELEMIVDDDEKIKAGFESHERQMLKRVFDFYEKRVSEIMVPLVDIFALDESMLLKEALGLIESENFSKIPIFRERVDNITGVLYVHDIIKWEGSLDVSLKSLAKVPFFVPEYKFIAEVLEEFKKKKLSMAFVVDEYGGVLGIVTVEDILEELFGEISDEYDERDELFKKIAPNRYLIKGRAEISFLNEVLPFDIPEGNYETIAGFLLNELRHIPKVGETFDFGNVQFKIYRVDDRSIEDIMVIVKDGR